jgi:dTDP-glucose 4,6-dehydratase
LFTLPESDLEEIVAASESTFASLRGAHVFLTGGTGFVGSWLTESFMWANRRLALDARLTLLARDRQRLAPRFLRAADAGALDLAIGDVRTFGLAERPDVVINAATPATGHLDPQEIVDTIVGGTRNVLRVAARSGTIPVLFTSSGAVYGRQPPDLERISEEYSGGPDQLDTRAAYGEAKRIAELLHVAEARRSGVAPKIARLFAFVGPYLPLDAHFAIGNFIRDALQGGPIVLNSAGTAVRSYLYASDMTTWLWRILSGAEPSRAYNVGSEVPTTILDAARTVAACAKLPEHAVCVPSGSRADADRYVPDTRRTRVNLNLGVTTDLRSAVIKTLSWHKAGVPS